MMAAHQHDDEGGFRFVRDLHSLVRLIVGQRVVVGVLDEVDEDRMKTHRRQRLILMNSHLHRRHVLLNQSSEFRAV